jgi:hypothetical protein
MQENVAASAKPAIAAIAAHGTALKFSCRLSAGNFLGIRFVSLKLERSSCQFTVWVSKPDLPSKPELPLYVAVIRGESSGQRTPVILL